MGTKQSSDAASNAWAVQKDVLQFAGVGGSRGTKKQMAEFNLSQILDFIVCTIAGIVGQELYTTACPERDEIIADCKATLKKIAKCRRVKIGGHEILMNESQLSKTEMAFTVTQNGGDIGSWRDPADTQINLGGGGDGGDGGDGGGGGGGGGSHGSSKRGKKKRRQSTMAGMKNNKTGKSVLWIVQRMAKHPQLLVSTDKELDPIVDRALLGMWGSTVCEHEKKWYVVPSNDLWGVRPAPKVKLSDRADGSVVKLISYIVGGALVKGNKANTTIHRLAELFYSVLKAAKDYRGIRTDGKLDKNGFPRMVYFQIPDIKGARQDYLDLVVSQLTKTGMCEVLMYLLGLPWLEEHVYETVVSFAVDILKYSHVVKEDSRVVQENMIAFLSQDVGEPATLALARKLEESQQWAKARRQGQKQRLKALKSEIKAAKKAVKQAKQDGGSGGGESPMSERKASRGAAAEEELQKHLEQTQLGPIKAKSNKYSEQLAVMQEGDKDPGASGKLLRLLDLLCTGQYKKGQLFMSNQPGHKFPVNFLADAAKYISTMAKDFHCHHDDLLQAYSSLKSFLTGPCQPNQLSMAMETECVLITNRILRELFKQAKMTYNGMTSKTGTKIHLKSTIEERNQEKDKVAAWSTLAKEVVETLLSMIEGRTDNVVHHRILAVVQRRNLKNRLQTLQDKISSNFFNVNTERILTEEGVEIMNLLMTLCEHDKALYKEVMLGQSEPYYFFRSKMGRVEIIFHDNLLPVFFLIPPMCQVFSHTPLGKMWDTCLPRDESTLVKYQYESMRIFDMMKQERQLVRAGVSKFFGTGKLAFMAQVSFTMALLINGISIYTLAYTESGDNGTTYQWTPPYIVDLGLTTQTVQDVLTLIQTFSSSYLLISSVVLNLPVIYRTAARDRLTEREKLGLGKVVDPWAIPIALWAALTDFMFLYQCTYLGFAILSIYFQE